MSLSSRSPSQYGINRPSITEQVQSYRQRVDPNTISSSSFTHGSHFKTINSQTPSTLSSPTSKIYAKQLSLFFHKKGTSTPSRHGSPMIKHYNKFDRISDWQIYLQQEVLVHPAWRSYPKIKDFEIYPHIPIRVGYWEGGNTQPAANELLGSGSISDLLRLVKNPKTFEGSSAKLSGIGKGGKSSAQPIKMVFTIHIRYKDDSDTSLSDEKSLSSADIEGELLNSHPSDYLIEQQPSASETAELRSLSAPVSVVTQPQRRRKPKHRKSRAVAISNSSDSDIQIKPSSYANQPSFFSVVSPPSSISSTMKPPPPTTPPTTQPEAIKPPSACSSTPCS